MNTRDTLTGMLAIWPDPRTRVPLPIPIAPANAGPPVVVDQRRRLWRGRPGEFDPAGAGVDARGRPGR